MKTNRLTTFREIIHAYPESHIKYKNGACEQDPMFVNTEGGCAYGELAATCVTLARTSFRTVCTVSAVLPSVRRSTYRTYSQTQ
jgi:hypothetical protein